jgi:acyl dehydratase
MIEIGHIFPTAQVVVNREKLIAYANASGDQNPIHQDEAFAKSVGLPDVIAHGMFTLGSAATYVAKIAGGSQNVRELSAKFTKPVVVPADVDVILNITAKVTEVLPTALKLEITLTCDEVKVLGAAKAMINI